MSGVKWRTLNELERNVLKKYPALRERCNESIRMYDAFRTFSKALKNDLDRTFAKDIQDGNIRRCNINGTIQVGFIKKPTEDLHEDEDDLF